MSVLETLEIRFAADLGNVSTAVQGLTGALKSLNTFETAAAQGLARLNTVSLSGLAPRLRTEGLQAAQAYAGGLRSGASAARTAGLELSRGFARGILAGKGTVMAAAAGVANAAAAKMRAALDIHSPSRVGADIGTYFAEGFALGLEGGVRRAEQAAAALTAAATAPKAVPAAAEPATSAPQTLPAAPAPTAQTITVPLVVDGVKLGEACIRGINAVSRTTGRVRLEL